jgi:1-hydroxycarotenoid 3,4-desaturase
VIGAGIAGLVAALELSCRDLQVTLIERAATPGGKMRQVHVDGAAIDAGPTVFTLRAIFEEIFECAGTSLAAHVRLRPLELLARHAWSEAAHLDLYADIERSADAIGRFAGAAEAQGYRRFCADARDVYDTLERSFLRQSRPSLPGLVRSSGPAQLWRLRPFTTLWSALGGYFRDPRLQQLFGRYATYCGSSPFLAPATLMLVAHVEQQGVWQIDGGMYALASALLALVRARGVTVRLATHVSGMQLRAGRLAMLELAGGESLPVDAAIITSDAAALAAGLYGAELAPGAQRVAARHRSLSAMTWNLHAPTSGFELSRHNVFFGADCAREFADLCQHRRMPETPTVYVCAQDRAAASAPCAGAPERLLCLINAPAIGDVHRFDSEEVALCLNRTLATLRRCGLQVQANESQAIATTPADFERLFPGSGGAIYGQATHGWRASFQRPGAGTCIPGLYLAGGSIHPGPGLPMAALSGRHAAACLRQDLDSIGQSRRAGMRGGMSMR